MKDFKMHFFSQLTLASENGGLIGRLEDHSQTTWTIWCKLLMDGSDISCHACQVVNILMQTLILPGAIKSGHLETGTGQELPTAAQQATPNLDTM